MSSTERSHASPGPAAARAPWWVRMFSPVARPLLAAGVPLGPNGLLTVRGRITGEPRTTPVAVIDVGGRRWIWAPWGEVNWVRNLRASGRATITVRGRPAEVRATELDQPGRTAFFRDTLGPHARSIPFGYWFIRVADGTDLNHPEEAAKDRRVFELYPIAD